MKRLLLSISSATVLVLWGMGSAPLAYGRQRRVAIPSGTEIQVRLGTQLDTGKARAGETFTGTVAKAVESGGRTVLGQGAAVSGRVVEAVSSGRLKRPASITLELTSVSTEPLKIDGKSHLVRNAELIGGGTAAGALLGALAGGKKGAAIGAAVGAGAGTATAYMTGKKEIVIPPETLLTFVVASGATASVAGQTAQPASTYQQRQGTTSQTGGGRAYEGRARDSYEARRGGAGSTSALEFSPRDQRIIRDYYASETSNLPPGLAKRGGNLPPGLERQLQRNGTLPPGLQRRVQPFPAELDSQLPQLPSGYSRVYLEGRALILDRNNKILDLMVAVTR
jgi:Glycine zipper